MVVAVAGAIETDGGDEDAGGIEYRPATKPMTVPANTDAAMVSQRW